MHSEKSVQPNVLTTKPLETCGKGSKRQLGDIPVACLLVVDLMFKTTMCQCVLAHMLNMF